MASDRRAKPCIAAAIVLFTVIGATASRIYPEPRLMMLCALAALLIAGMMWHFLGLLAPRQSAVLPETPIGVPQDRDALVAAALMLEACLEHAPVALFKIDGSDGAGKAAPLNIMARRMLALGRAIDPAALYREIGTKAIGGRGMIEFETEHGMERTLLSLNEIRLEGRMQRLAALVPLESQLEAEALHAWREMTHVLTHEIMNSLTPVASLSRTAFELLDDLLPGLPADESTDLARALDTISRRAESLARFVENYRTLSGIPAACPEQINLNDAFSRLAALLSPSWNERGGSIEFTVEPASLELIIDPGQFEQMLINLIRNAADATADIERPRAAVSAKLSRGSRLRVEVTDNGPGVDEASIPHIFTPFFSTKEKGSGIGLAMVRQLAHGNGGTVRYAKSLNGGARFILMF